MFVLVAVAGGCSVVAPVSLAVVLILAADFVMCRKSDIDLLVVAAVVVILF
jgi:hypothetical protein